jgi:hypothetical protein
LYLSGGDPSWPVTYRIQTQGGSFGRIEATGIIDLEGRAVVTLQHHISDPNDFFLLKLSDGRWVHLIIKSINNGDECEIEKGAYIVDPPSWAEKGGA